MVKKRLRNKLILTTMVTLAIALAMALAVVAYLQVRTSTENLDAIRENIRSSLKAKGGILVANQALALRGFVDDNAFGDVRELVNRTVTEDAEIVYGIFVDADLTPWVFTEQGKPMKEGDPSDRWKKLELTEDSLNQEETLREFHVFEDDVFEFTGKVEIDGELLGNIRYGLSTKPMTKAIIKSEEESISALKRVLFAVGIVALIAMFVGWLVTRRQADRITKPVGVLTDAADSLAQGDHSVQVDVSSGDEIELLASSFNKMVRDLASSYEELETLNKSLEDKVTERTQELAQKTVDIENMLQNMQQGIFTIMAQQVIHHEYSRYLEEILQTTDIAGRKVMDLLFQDTELGEDALDRIYVALENTIGRNALNFTLNSHLLVREFNKTLPDGSRRILEVDWNGITDNTKNVTRIMVTLRDVTEIRRLEMEANAKKRQLEIVGQILAVEIGDFTTFMGMAEQFLDRNEYLINSTTVAEVDVVGELFRNMHTIKGNARTYSFSYMNDIVHQAENIYKDLRGADNPKWEPDILLKDLGEVRAALQEYDDVYNNELKGLGQKDSGSEVSGEFLGELETIIEKANEGSIDSRQLADELSKTLQPFRSKPLKDMLSGPISGMGTIASELEKPTPRMVLNAKDILIPRGLESLIQNVFTHILRNSIDHGLEPADQRIEEGKNPEGTIVLDASSNSGKLVMKVYDDGRGLNLNLLKERHYEITGEFGEKTESELAETIFMSGISTATEVTDISGRGVGMDAVRAFLEERGGSADVELTGISEKGFHPFKVVLTVPIEESQNKKRV